MYHMSQTAALQQMISLSPGSLPPNAGQRGRKNSTDSEEACLVRSKGVVLSLAKNKCQELTGEKIFVWEGLGDIMSSNLQSWGNFSKACPSQQITINPWTLYSINVSSAPRLLMLNVKQQGAVAPRVKFGCFYQRERKKEAERRIQVNQVWLKV